MIKVEFFPEGKEIEIEKKLAVKKLLRRLDLLPGTALVIRDGKLLTSDIVIKEGDEIEIRIVTSKG